LADFAPFSRRAGRRFSSRVGRAPQVVAAQLDKVEGVQEHVAIMAPIPNPVERRHAVLVTGDGLAVDDAGARLQAGQGLNDQREAVGQIVARTAIEIRLRAVLAGDDPETVVFDLVQRWQLGKASCVVLTGRA
jgi:hypothetical protein